MQKVLRAIYNRKLCFLLPNFDLGKSDSVAYVRVLLESIYWLSVLS